MSVFQGSGAFNVVGAAFSRASDGIVKTDLSSPDACYKMIADVKPSVVIHAAAERKPDVCEKDPAGSETLNVEAVWHLARAAHKANAVFIQISTDYLWDGTAAPYKEDAPACPLNEYGRQKLRGEYAALAAHPGAIVLRVPVLYGPTGDMGESAVTMFAATVMAAGKPATVDDWQIRVPTFTPDIARTLLNISRAALEDANDKKPRGVFHYSSAERYTRWGFVRAFAGLLGLPADHVTRLDGAPPGAPRPYDCQLDCGKLAALGLAAPCTPFLEGARQVLQGAGLKVVDA